MRTSGKVLFVILVLALVLALPSVAFADKGGVANGGNKDVAHDKVNSSNGSGDKKAPESNGKNTATPDQDGKGADHGEVNDDKQWDGNNGCGNDKNDPDSPFEDDNNGKCKGLNKDEPDEGSTDSDEGSDDKSSNDGGDMSTVTEDSIRVCFYSHGNAVEVSNAAGLSLDPDTFESTVIAEDWHRVCWDAKPGDVYYVLAWNERSGHGGPVYKVEIGLKASNADIHNPFWGSITISGVIVTRLDSGEEL